MKKIISFVLIFVIILSFISCNKEQEPVNTKESEITSEIPVSSEPVPAVETKVYDFNEREKGENIYITLDDLKKLYAEAESIYREYDIVRGKIQKHTYPLKFETYEGEPTFEYYDTEIYTVHEIMDKIDKKDNSLNIKDAVKCSTDVCLIFMMNITLFCKEGMVLSEYSKDGLAWTHGSGIASTYWYSILLYSKIIPQEPKEILKGSDVLFITKQLDELESRPLVPNVRIKEKNVKETHSIEFHDGLYIYVNSLKG